ncbi:Lrp/AsnC family transcriptional regulator [Roseiterribacter gracilis]|uniref:AsnC family transcriptional regulator n=1 Tax=Roseiterribacter gracilis TaxID=2812848 RepID=A0A8S8X5X7_9PROT|nr:AsnC family transcriptional regulator [Rhodospirillales bacterium TMPK1]
MNADDLDSFDLALLREVQSDNQITSAALAERVNLSPSACLRRLQKLHESGLIRRDAALLDYAALGRGLTVMTLVALKVETSGLGTGFAARVGAHAYVTQCMSVTGEFDFALTLRLTSMQEYERFIEAELLNDANVARFVTLVGLKETKFETAIPLDHLRR